MRSKYRVITRTSAEEIKQDAEPSDKEKLIQEYLEKEYYFKVPDFVDV